MNHTTALAATMLALGAAALTRQNRGTDGRWVMLGAPIAYVFSGDSVEIVMYPPQAPPMSYRVRRDTIETSAADAHTTQAFSIRGDTLHLAFGNRVIAYHRLAAAPMPGEGLTGTWQSIDGNGVSILTFRSDGQLVLEIEAPARMRLHGDTLDTMAGGQTLRSILQRAGDSITIRPVSGDKPPAVSRSQVIVRRPWSCFGLAALDRTAIECR